MNNITSLIYFGDTNNSLYGTLRSTIAITLIMIWLIFATYISKLEFDWVRMIMLAVALTSAICVIVPYSNYDAAKYGASIGLLTCLIILSVSDLEADKIWFAISAIAACTIVSVIVYQSSTALGWYPFPPCQN